MRIIIVGGNINSATGDTNVVKATCHKYLNRNEVFWYPFLPVLNKTEAEGDLRIVKKNLSIELLLDSFLQLYSWFGFIKPYIVYSPRGVAYIFITLYEKVYFSKMLKLLEPDVVHIHGLGIHTVPFIQSCNNHNIPYVVTCHGLDTLNKQINTFYNTALEHDTLNWLLSHNIPVTVVSSSVLRKIKEGFNLPTEGIEIIQNGVDMAKFGHNLFSKEKLRMKYEISTKKFIILQVGTINKRKNHIAVLKAIKSMEDSIRNSILYFIVGDGNERSQLVKFIEENGLNESVIVMGRVDDTKLIDCYHLSDCFILPSTSEGLPLVFLEALAAGLPIITFNDLDGVEELYNERCFELMYNRTNESIVEGIRGVMRKDWDPGFITEYARKWSWEKVCDLYMGIYLKITSKCQ